MSRKCCLLVLGVWINSVQFSTTPPKGQSLKDFRPDFAAADVVVINYEADEWPSAEWALL